MKICIVVTLYFPYVLGGAEISTKILAENLLAMGNKIVVITVGDTFKIENINGVKIYRIKNRNIYWRYPQREKNKFIKSIWHGLDSYANLYYPQIRNL